MHKVKWIFFGYLSLVALVVLGIALSFGMTPTRDPHSLYVAYGSNIKTLDPASIGDTTSSGVAGQLFETLYNYDYEARPYTLIPELAAELPHVSEDGRTVTIKLRPGIHYYDPDGKIPGWEPVAGEQGRKGPEIKAGDFIYAWKRVANFHQASQNYSAMFEGKIEGLAEWRDYTKSSQPNEIDWDRRVKGFEAVDDRTIRIHLTQPDPQLRYNLAHLPAAPVSRDAANYWGDDIRHHPIGSGAYYLDQHLPEQRIVLKANPVYRGRSDIDGNVSIPPDQRLPHIQRVQMDYFDEDLPMWALFQQGMLDINGIPKDTFTQAIDARTSNLTPELAEKGIVLRKDPYPAVFFYGFNMEDPVVGKNKPLRQAMSMAFNRAKFIELFMNGRGQPAIGPIPPGFPTFDEKLVNPNTQFDLTTARARMTEAEQIHGGPIPTITFLMPGTDTTARQQGEFIKRQMAQIGLNIEVDFTTWARFQEMIDNKQAQFYGLGWVADYPDEQTFLQLFWSKNAAPGPNSANYSNPAFDALYETARVMQPGPERNELYRRMQQIVMEDTPWLMTFYPVQYMLYYDWVSNLNTTEYAHGNRKFYRLDEGLRQARLGN